MLRFSHKVLALGAILALPLALQPFTSDFSIIAKAEAKGGNGGGNGGGGNGGGNGGSSVSSSSNGANGKGGFAVGNAGRNGKAVGGDAGSRASGAESIGDVFGKLGAALGIDGLSKGQTKQAEIDSLIASLNDDYDFGFTNRGDVRSMLGSLNARNASPTAFANAAPGSQVGRIKAYTEAIEATNLSVAELAEAIAALDAFESEFGPVADLATRIDEATAALTEAQEAEASLVATNQAQIAQLETEIELANNSLTELEAELEDLQRNLESSPEDIIAAQARVSEAEIAVANLSANETTIAELQAEIDLAGTVVEEKDQDLARLESAQEQLPDLETALSEAEKAENTAATTEFAELEAAYNKELEDENDPVAAAIRDVFDPQPAETEGTEG